MKSTWVIAKRELNSFFDSLIAYVMIIIFLGLTGFFTWLFSGNIFVINQANLSVFFGISYWTLFFFIPAITMRTLAEEKRSGTIELLSTKSITDWQIVSGKFLGSLLLVAIALLCTVPYYLTVSQLGPVDHGSVIGGYAGLLLLSGVYISIGVFTSSITDNQIVAFLLALAVGFCFHLGFELVANLFTGSLNTFFRYLSINKHFDSISRGVIDLRDLVYFGSFIFTGLFLSQLVLSKRNWQD